MSRAWADAALSTYQDHVVAHVVGAAVLGHFVHDEALHLVLDINFVWTIFVDGEMLLRHERLALAELGLADAERAALEAEFDALHADESDAAPRPAARSKRWSFTSGRAGAGSSSAATSRASSSRRTRARARSRSRIPPA